MIKFSIFSTLLFLSSCLLAEEVKLKCDGIYQRIGDKKEYSESRIYFIDVENKFFLQSQSFKTIKKTKSQDKIKLLTNGFIKTDTHLINNFYDSLSMIEIQLRLDRFDLKIFENMKSKALNKESIFKGKCYKVKVKI